MAEGGHAGRHLSAHFKYLAMLGGAYINLRMVFDAVKDNKFMVGKI